MARTKIVLPSAPAAFWSMARLQVFGMACVGRTLWRPNYLAICHGGRQISHCGRGQVWAHYCGAKDAPHVDGPTQMVTLICFPWRALAVHVVCCVHLMLGFIFNTRDVADRSAMAQPRLPPRRVLRSTGFCPPRVPNFHTLCPGAPKVTSKTLDLPSPLPRTSSHGPCFLFLENGRERRKMPWVVGVDRSTNKSVWS